MSVVAQALAVAGSLVARRPQQLVAGTLAAVAASPSPSPKAKDLLVVMSVASSQVARRHHPRLMVAPVGGPTAAR
jgi:hypothetical protein